MAVGKQSLNRVAKSGVAEAEVTATAEVAQKAPETKPAVKAATVKVAPSKETKKVCAGMGNKIYKVGEPLPVHLL